MSSVIYRGRPTQVDTKDPDATVSYGLDWTDYLDGKTMLTSEWLPDSEDIVVEASSMADAPVTSVLLSGGTAGTRYKVTNRITFAGANGNETDDRTIIVPVREL